MNRLAGPNPPRPPCRVTELLGVLSLASDAGVGLPLEHSLRVCYIATSVAARMGLSAQQQDDVYHTALLKDAGCTSWTTQLATFIRNDEIAARRDFLFPADPSGKRDVLGWMLKYVGGHQLGVFQRTGRIVDFMAHGRDFTREGYQSAVEVARRIAQRLGLGEGVQDALLSVFEQWDGGGMPLGIRGEAIPVASRVVFPSIYAEVSYQAGGIDAALKMLAARSGEAFDPGVVVAFESLAMDKPFWRGLEQESLWQTVLDMTPTPPRLSSQRRRTGGGGPRHSGLCRYEVPLPGRTFPSRCGACSRDGGAPGAVTVRGHGHPACRPHA